MQVEDKKLKKLEALKEMQAFQNQLSLEDRLASLEATVQSVTETLWELQLAISSLQMDFHRDHTTLQNVDR